MKVWTEIESFKAHQPVVTIGVFDGVHRGHRFLLDELKEEAARRGGESVAVTLWPHPRIVLNKEPEKLRYLTTMDEKIMLLEETGIDHLMIIPFTREFSRLDSCGFVKEYLVDRMHMEYLIIGYNHKFGRNREGDFASLGKCAEEYGFGLKRLSPLELKGDKLSSSVIRNLLHEGETERAGKLLGYRYFIRGRVQNGNKLGRKIGFPTANVRPDDPHKLIPKDGVYAVELEYRGSLHKGMLNIGKRPTIDNTAGGRSIEVNLFDFNEDLYDKDVSVHFRKRMRDEKKFDSLEQLRKQLVIDKSMAVKILDEVPDESGS